VPDCCGDDGGDRGEHRHAAVAAVSTAGHFEGQS
jgi:hypothetical protein